MRFEILNVGHGFCAYLETDNDRLVLFDCGHKAEPEFRPSDYLYNRGHRSVTRLFITNYDEDHISNLPRLKEDLPIKILHRNNSISADQLRKLKLELGPLTPAMSTLLEMIGTYNSEVTDPPLLPNVSWNSYSHGYGSDFDETNNISLVTFLRAGDLNVLIPGDLEEAGWEGHLENASFRQSLEGVDIFVASHHGRESGYYPEVFDYCRPSIIVISDGPKKYATQEMVDKYAQHATGIQFNGEPRRVLTTRKDGSIYWEQ